MACFETLNRNLETMFITPAFAQGASGGADPFSSLLIPMLLMVVIFYFLLFRPQQQRAKETKEMLSKIRRGDTVVTAAGFMGRVTKVADNSDEVEVELTDTLRVRVIRGSITEVRSKNEPVKDAAKP